MCSLQLLIWRRQPRWWRGLESFPLKKDRKLLQLLERPWLTFRRRIIVAQNGKDIYIVISVYNDGWLQYINQSTPTEEFMTMYRYGPYPIDDAQAVREFSETILSLLT
jgi:hypothetical protein